MPYARLAVRFLKAADPALAALIKRIGPCRAVAQPGETFEALLQAICYQQLAGKAAATIHGRLLALLKGKPVTAEQFERLGDKELRAAGLSANKLAAMRDLARKARDGALPRRKVLETMSDEQIIACLTEVRGVGVWTAQMFLMFRLGRPDVLPSGDFGVRKAAGLLYKKRSLPSPQAVERLGRPWAPYRTIASWYLWRSLDDIG